MREKKHFSSAFKLPYTDSDTIFCPTFFFFLQIDNGKKKFQKGEIIFSKNVKPFFFSFFFIPFRFVIQGCVDYGSNSISGRDRDRWRRNQVQTMDNRRSARIVNPTIRTIVEIHLFIGRRQT